LVLEGLVIDEVLVLNNESLFLVLALELAREGLVTDEIFS
ncbi:2705_t:CDS:1, partial [Dentiscutata heterogama]